MSLGEDAGTLPALLIEGAELYRLEAQAQLTLTLRFVGVALLLLVGGWVLWLLAGLMRTYVLIPGLAL